MTGAYREYRVPTTSLDVEILAADGRTFQGRIFVPDVAATHRGPMRAAEWMNEASSFFPFVPADGSGSVLLNRSEVLVCTVNAEADADLDDPDGAGGLLRRVVVECRDRRFEGEVVIDMPPHQRRVSDFLNRPDPFLIVRDGPRHHLIRKARITRIIEPRETT
jgi:hypothetical protein